MSTSPLVSSAVTFCTTTFVKSWLTLLSKIFESAHYVLMQWIWVFPNNLSIFFFFAIYNEIESEQHRLGCRSFPSFCVSSHALCTLLRQLSGWRRAEQRAAQKQVTEHFLQVLSAHKQLEKALNYVVSQYIIESDLTLLYMLTFSSANWRA